MKLEKKDDGWWIVNTPPGVEEMGPYKTKEEAEDDKRGVQKFLEMKR